MPVSTADSLAFSSHAAVDPLASSLFASPPPSSSRGPLHPGAVWEGLQRSGRNSYKVRVNIDTVDLDQGTVSGLLQIQHLTPELESLVTFFEGEIIGEKAGFRTARWGATEADDMKHWSRFPAFSKSLRNSLIKPNLNFKQHQNKPYLFMRWKEQFVVPSSHAQNIHGASFAGFYYLCLDFVSSPDDLPSPSPSPSAFPSRADRERTLSPPASRLGAPSRRLSTGSNGGRSRPPMRSPTAPSGGGGIGLGRSIDEEREQSSSEGLSISTGAGNRSRSHSTNAVASTSSGSTSTSPPNAPPRPRRASSASGFSYAAVVRGAGSPTSPPAIPLPLDSLAGVERHEDSTTLQRLPGFAPSHLLHPPPSPSEMVHTPEASTPKEGAQDPTHGFDFNFSSLSLSLGLGAGGGGGDEPSSSSTTHLSSSSSSLDRPLSYTSPPLLSPPLPTPLGTSLDDFPVPSSPPPSAAMMRRQSSEGAGPSSSATGTGWDSPYPARPPSVSRRRSSFGRSSRAFAEQQQEFGLHSYSQAKMTGFYFFRHSEPYQELSLRYVPGTRRGGSDSFEFR